MVTHTGEHGDQKNIWTVGEEANEGMRKIYVNKELRTLYLSPNTVMVLKWGGNVLCLAEVTNMCKIFVRKPEGKRPF